MPQGNLVLGFESPGVGISSSLVGAHFEHAIFGVCLVRAPKLSSPVIPHIEQASALAKGTWF